jgi:hypothetical protein
MNIVHEVTGMHIRSREAGAVNLIAVLFLGTGILAVLATVVVMNASSLTDSARLSRSVQALLLAESGVESAVRQYGTNGTCDATGVGVGSSSQGSGSVSIDNAFTTDFSGVVLAANSCRIQVTGTAADNTARVLQVIAQRSSNLLPTSANANFNAPAGVCNPATCTPTGWLLSASGSSLGTRWDDTGGPDGSRSAYVAKNNGPSAGTTAGQFTFSPAVTVTGPITLTFTFDYKHENGEPAPNTMGVIFSLSEQAPGTLTWSTSEFLSNRAPGYRSGSLDLTIPQTGTFVISSLNFSLSAKAGQAKQIYLDNISLQGSGGSGGNAQIIAWREPVTQ